MSFSLNLVPQGHIHFDGVRVDDAHVYGVTAGSVDNIVCGAELDCTMIRFDHQMLMERLEITLGRSDAPAITGNWLLGRSKWEVEQFRYNVLTIIEDQVVK